MRMPRLAMQMDSVMRRECLGRAQLRLVDDPLVAVLRMLHAVIQIVPLDGQRLMPGEGAGVYLRILKELPPGTCRSNRFGIKWTVCPILNLCCAMVVPGVVGATRRVAP